MPYRTNQELPDSLKDNLPSRARGLRRTARCFWHDYRAQDAHADEGCGFAVRKRGPWRGEAAWRQFLTTFTPEHWLVAQGRDRTRLPVKPGLRPAANR